jgi:prepilin-type processing-associated H-X9-DG protein
LQHITDGTSNTSMWSEMLTPPAANPVAGSGKTTENRAYFAVSGGPYLTATPAGVQQFLSACQSVPPGTAAQSSTMGYQWWSTYPSYVNSNYNHVGPPNSRQCQNQPLNAWGMDIYGTASPNSLHPGGVNMCLADGSVRFVKDTVNLASWWALGTRNGGEVLSSDTY